MCAEHDQTSGQSISAHVQRKKHAKDRDRVLTATWDFLICLNIGLSLYEI